jgi:hypothetical protein
MVFIWDCPVGSYQCSYKIVHISVLAQDVFSVRSYLDQNRDRDQPAYSLRFPDIDNTSAREKAFRRLDFVD